MAHISFLEGKRMIWLISVSETNQNRVLLTYSKCQEKVNIRLVQSLEKGGASPAHFWKTKGGLEPAEPYVATPLPPPFFHNQVTSYSTESCFSSLLKIIERLTVKPFLS